MARALAVTQFDQGGRFTSGVSEVTFEFTIESFNVDETSIDDALSKLENATFNTLTETLGSDSSVQFKDLSSTKVGKFGLDNPAKNVNSYLTDPVVWWTGSCAWSSTSNSCAEFEGTISLTGLTGTDTLVDRAVLTEVERFIDEFNSENSNIAVNFLGPSIVSTNIVVRLDNTDRIMNAREIAVFESTLLQVLAPPEDGVTFTSFKVYFQQENVEGRRRLLRTPSTDVYIRVDGTCKACTSGEFGLLVNDAVGSSSSKLEEELGNNDDGEYFNAVTVSTVSQQTVTPSHSESATSSAETTTKFPYVVLYALAGGVAIVLAGVFYIGNRNRKARMEEQRRSRKIAVAHDANDRMESM